MRRFSGLVVAGFVTAGLVVAAAPAVAQTVTIVAGDNQHLPRQGSEVNGGIARFQPLRVLVRDPAGQPVPNAPVTFHCNTGNRDMPCQLTPSGSDNGVLTVNTGHDGVATLDRMGGYALNVYYADGSLTVDARYQRASATFHLRVDPHAGAAYTLFAKVVSGDRQKATRVGEEPYGGIAHFGPITIQVTDASGHPVPGVRVWYGCVSAACDYANTPQYTTDGNGMFTLPGFVEYYGSGWITLQFVGPTMQSADAHELAVDPPKPAVTWVPGAKLVAVAGDNQSRPRTGREVPGGIASFGPMAVRLTAPDGTPVPNAPIQFACEKPTRYWDPHDDFACQFTPSGAENGTMTLYTDANGVATLNRMGGSSLNFYYNTGRHWVRATYGNIAAYTLHFSVTQ